MSNKTVNGLSYFAFVVAIALRIIGGILSGVLIMFLDAASTVIMYGVIAVNAYEFIRGKKKGWKVVYWVALIAAIVSIVLPFVI